MNVAWHACLAGLAGCMQKQRAAFVALELLYFWLNLFLAQSISVKIFEPK